MKHYDALAGEDAYLPPGVAFMAATSVEQMQADLQSINDQAEAIRAKAADEDRDLTDEETDQILDLDGKAEILAKRIKARTPTPAPQGNGRKTLPEVSAAAKPGERATVPAEARPNDPRNGFRTFGEYAVAVRSGCIQGNQPDRRLLNTASTYGAEGTGQDGGYLVPPAFSTEIWQKVMAEENLLTRCAQLNTASNSITIPKDETTPWQTTGGVQVYWEGEAAQVSASKPSFEMATIRLAKLFGLVPVSDELLEDAVGLESWLRAKAPAKMAAKINTAIISGTGVGQPLGILNSPSFLSVAKESSQPSNTIYFANINKMWSRMYAPWRRNAVWLINQDIEPQLDAMAFDPAATSKVPVYLPPGGVSNADYATLKGRPVVPIEACSTLSSQGDIFLVDFNQYWAITRAGGLRTDTSMHLYFDQALTTFRFIFRMNGMPAWSSVITRQNGNNTLTWAVTLDAR